MNVSARFPSGNPLCAIFFLAMWLLAGCSADPLHPPKVRIASGPPLAWGEEPAEQRINRSGTDRYLVQPGDTLWAIAAVHDIEVEDLAQWNHIANSDLLRVGQPLRLSPMGSPPSAPSAQGPMAGAAEAESPSSSRETAAPSSPPIIQRPSVTQQEITLSHPSATIELPPRNPMSDETSLDAPPSSWAAATVSPPVFSSQTEERSANQQGRSSVVVATPTAPGPPHTASHPDHAVIYFSPATGSATDSPPPPSIRPAVRPSRPASPPAVVVETVKSPLVAMATMEPPQITPRRTARPEEKRAQAAAAAVPPLPPVNQTAKVRQKTAKVKPESSTTATSSQPAAPAQAKAGPEPSSTLDKWRLPTTPPKQWQWPHTGKVITLFGHRGQQRNNGIDIAVQVGDPIRAAADGVVAYADSGLPGYGKMILIRHGGSYMTAYGYVNQILVRRGQPVKQGMRIALAGQSGRATSPRLHFEIRHRVKPLNPLKHLPRAKQ